VSTPWLTVAEHLHGEKRIRGPRDNPDIVEMFRLSGFDNMHDDTAWCAAFVGACLRLAGYANLRSLRAADYMTFGETLTQPRRGAIVVFEPLAARASGHVGFFDRRDGNSIYVLGGNQGSTSEVSLHAFPASKVRSYRWPVETAPLPDRPALPTILEIAPEEAPPHLGGSGTASVDVGDRPPVPEAWDEVASDVFERAQTIIDGFEGGFRQSPDENGGACNFGVSRATLAEWRGRPVSIEEVRELTRAEAHQIYRARFWKKIGGDTLPPGVALIVYNLAVLGGPGRAVTFLQRALDQLGEPVAVDGGIGPETLGAALRVPPAALIETFAKIEAAFHSASAKTQYIAGWLKRLDGIKRTALSWTTQAAPEPRPAPVGAAEASESELAFQPLGGGLSFGDVGARVRMLQTSLREAGYPLGGVDGEFGSLTRAAVLAFQADHGLPVTGGADAATLAALDKEPRRPLAPERLGAGAEDLRQSGSRIVADAENAKLAGLISTVLGGLGLGNSTAVEIAQKMADGAGQVAAAAPAKPLADPTRLIDALQKAAALPKLAKTPELDNLLGAIRELQGAALDKMLSPDALQTLNLIKKVMAPSDLLKQPLVSQFFEQLPAAPATTATATTAAKTLGSVFDLLPGLFNDGALQTVSQGLAIAANSVVPGFGGSLATLGLGLAMRLFADRIVKARVDDHRNGANLDR
jgi:uncharacterized protein (TIGR02594 family)